MFASFRRHQSWIWLIVVIVVSISMIIFFTPDKGPNSSRKGKGGFDFGSINGQAIERDEFLSTYREVQIGHFFRTGGREWPGTDAESDRGLKQQTGFRVFLIRKMNELDIKPSMVAVGRSILKSASATIPTISSSKTISRRTASPPRTSSVS